MRDASVEAAMNRCPECDWELEVGDELCPNCGAILADYEDFKDSEGFEA